MAFEQEPQSERTNTAATVDELERAHVPPLVEKEILRLARSHTVEIELNYGNDGTTADTLTVKDADTGEVLLYEDFKMFNQLAREQQTREERADRRKGQRVIAPPDLGQPWKSKEK